MKTIWKFELPLRNGGEQIIDMPVLSRILCVQDQNGILCIWAVVDPKKEMTKRKFLIVGTGYESKHIPLDYIGTVQQMSGALIWHIFEEIM